MDRTLLNHTLLDHTQRIIGLCERIVLLCLFRLFPLPRKSNTLGTHYGPHTIGPHTIGPHTIGPHTIGPHTIGPHTIGPHTIGPHTKDYH